MSIHSPDNEPHAELIIPIVNEMEIDDEERYPQCTPLIVRDGIVEEVRGVVKFANAVKDLNAETGIKSVNAHVKIHSPGGYKDAMDTILSGLTDLDNSGGISHSYAPAHASSAAIWTFLAAKKRAITAEAETMFHSTAMEFDGGRRLHVSPKASYVYKRRMFNLIRNSGADAPARRKLLHDLAFNFLHGEDPRNTINWTGQQLADLGYADLLEDGDALGRRFAENTGVNVEDPESLAIIQAQWSSFIEQIKTSS